MKIVLVHPPLEAEQAVGASKSIALVTNIIAPLGIAYIAMDAPSVIGRYSGAGFGRAALIMYLMRLKS